MPTGTEHVRMVRLQLIFSTTVSSPVRRTTPTLVFSRFIAMPVAPEANSISSLSMQFRRPVTEATPSDTADTLPISSLSSGEKKIFVIRLSSSSSFRFASSTLSILRFEDSGNCSSASSRSSLIFVDGNSSFERAALASPDVLTERVCLIKELILPSCPFTE